MKINPPVATRQSRLRVGIQLVTLGLLVAHAAQARAATFTAASYNGLFSETDGTNSLVNQRSSGCLTLSVREAGTFTGKLYMSEGSSTGGGGYPLSGRFDAEGKQTLTILRQAAHKGPLTLALEYAPAGQTDTITGQVTDTNWTAQLQAYRSYQGAGAQAPQAGQYTLQLRPPAAGDSPAGIGVVRVLVSLKGRLTFAGRLADNTSFSRFSYLCREGRWPFYVPLYQGQGSMLGWVEFDAANSLSGEIGWTKLPLPQAKYYRQGFTNVVELLGFPYLPPRAGTRPLNFSKGIVVFSGGPLSQAFTNAVTLSGRGKVSAHTRSPLNFKINPLTGLFTGTAAKVPGLGNHVPVSGAVFQSPLNQGYGSFRANGQTGTILFYGDYQ